MPSLLAKPFFRLPPHAGVSRGRRGNVSGQAFGGFFEVSALEGLLEDRSTETSREPYGESSRESGILLALRYGRTQSFAAVVLLTLALVFLLDGAALASALAVEGALLFAYLVRPSESDDAEMRLAERRLIAANSWLLLAFAALCSLVTAMWRATYPFGTGGDTVSLLAVVASLFFVGRMGAGANARPGVAWLGFPSARAPDSGIRYGLGVRPLGPPLRGLLCLFCAYALALALARCSPGATSRARAAGFCHAWVASGSKSA